MLVYRNFFIGAGWVFNKRHSEGNKDGNGS